MKTGLLNNKLHRYRTREGRGYPFRNLAPTVVTVICLMHCKTMNRDAESWGGGGRGTGRAGAEIRYTVF